MKHLVKVLGLEKYSRRIIGCIVKQMEFNYIETVEN